MFFKLRKYFICENQKEVANYLNVKYIIPYFTEIPIAWQIKPKQKIDSKKIIWQFWYQGVDDATLPPLVHSCFASIEKYMSDYKIIRLTKDTISNYIDLPDFVFEKTKKGQFKYAHFSDVLRLCLLCAYGGVWIDAKMLLTAPIPESLLSTNFFMFQRTDEQPADADFWEHYYSKYFSWDRNFKVRTLNSFIISDNNHYILEIVKDILLNFWKNENKPRNYFLFQILFNEIIMREECDGANCEIVNDIDPHRLEAALKHNFSQQEWNEICAKSFIHKLRFVKSYRKNSFYQNILDGKN
ncbi:MAG: capsular polysaccharide synthesis protein [Prevotellaceae bacterium]|jgi:hypothetical protein|nr:capsular polysaccharide synthesis protein [Prevotellaceae bacterium]